MREAIRGTQVELRAPQGSFSRDGGAIIRGKSGAIIRGPSERHSSSPSVAPARRRCVCRRAVDEARGRERCPPRRLARSAYERVACAPDDGGNQRSSEVIIRGHHQRSSSEVIRGHQRSSERVACAPGSGASGGHSGAIRCAIVREGAHSETSRATPMSMREAISMQSAGPLRCQQRHSGAIECHQSAYDVVAQVVKGTCRPHLGATHPIGADASTTLGVRLGHRHRADRR